MPRISALLTKLWLWWSAPRERDRLFSLCEEVIDLQKQQIQLTTQLIKLWNPPEGDFPTTATAFRSVEDQENLYNLEQAAAQGDDYALAVLNDKGSLEQYLATFR